MNTTIEFTDHEMMALLLLLKVGMDNYTGSDPGLPSPDVMTALMRVPNRVIDRLIAKVSFAGDRAASFAHEGEA